MSRPSRYGIANRFPWKRSVIHVSGFSLVEIMISTLLFAMVSAGSLGMFSITTRQAAITSRLQEEEFAIRLDMANIQNMNDRFTCASGSCLIDNVGDAPGQAEYYPSSSTAKTKFDFLCRQAALLVVPDSSYGTGLIALIQATSATTQMQNLGISRTVQSDSTSPLSHRYSVTWFASDQTLLRQITLVPTAAAWCPG